MSAGGSPDWGASAATHRGNVVRYVADGHYLHVTLPQFHADAFYEIPLAHIETARDFCNWLGHLMEKAWADAELLGMIVIAIDDAIGLRGLS
jgi:hypothetical protein